jgi:hypothetical protein
MTGQTNVKRKLLAKKIEKKQKLMEDEDPNKVYEVQRIVDRRIGENGNFEYLIKWKNYGSNYNTWEPMDFLNCPALVSKFDAKINGASKKIKTKQRPILKKRIAKMDAKSTKTKKPTEPENELTVIQASIKKSLPRATVTKETAKENTNVFENIHEEGTLLDQDHDVSTTMNRKVKVEYMAKGNIHAVTHVYFTQDGESGDLQKLPYKDFKEQYPLALLDYFEPHLQFMLPGGGATQLE